MKVILGFEESGEPCYITIAHTVITGITDLSGKSTTGEAIFRRAAEENSQIKILVFLTKRGEKTYADANRIQPYYKERFDWEYVRGLLEAAMKERMKFETPWIIRIAKRSRSLKEFRRILGEELAREKLRDFDRNIYTLLAAYLDKVLPTLEQAKDQITDRLELKPGLNVMDLTPWYTHEEVQMLVIRSCMEHILEKENQTIVGMPEAWKLLPQTRNTPVKLYFEKFIREGATNGNFLHIDAQDLGGVDKTTLRQVSVWIMGKMLEANEVERLLKQTLRLDVRAEEVQTLTLGRFIVADGTSNKVKKVYVWPYGVPREMAVAVAKGNLSPDVIKQWIQKRQKEFAEAEKARAIMMNQTPLIIRMEELEKRFNNVCDKFSGLELSVTDKLRKLDEDWRTYTLDKPVEWKAGEELPDALKEQIGKIFKELGANTPLNSASAVRLEREIPVTVVEHEAKEIVKTTKTMEGQIMFVVIKHFAGVPFSEEDLVPTLAQYGWMIRHTSLAPLLGSVLPKQGLLKKLGGRPPQYQLPEYVKIRVQEN